MQKLAALVDASAGTTQSANVDIGAGVLVAVEWSAGRMTGALIQDVYDTEQPREIAACLASLLVAWDVTDDNDTPLDPANPDNLLKLPLSALLALLQGIQAAARPDPKAETSFSPS